MMFKAVSLIILTLLFVSSSLIFIDITAAQEPICDFTVNDIDFGYMSQGSTSNSVTSTVTNNGIVPVTSVLIRGENWQGAGTIPVGNTRWSTDDITYELLSTYDQPVSLILGPSDDIFFKLDIPSNQAAGYYTQQITLTFECSL